MIEISIKEKRWRQAIIKSTIFTRKIVNHTLQEMGVKHYNPTISLCLANDHYLNELNLQYRQKDEPTNVLSFPAEKLNLNCHLGDIAFSLETIEKESLETGISISDHFAHIIVHGVLHILNYDHQTDTEAEIMENLEIQILQKLNIPNPYC